MSLDFWNNPIVVSSFRTKFRKTNPMHLLTAYPVCLLLLGMAVPYFWPQIAREWPRIAFYILVGLQLLLSGVLAGSSAASAMKSEVSKQTLDFQRISSLSPRQILLGKLLGESAQAFFLALSTFPLAVLCFAVGAVPLEYVGIAYLILMTHTLMCGALGLVVQLEMRNNKAQGGGLWVVVLFLEWQSGSGLAVALARNPEWLIPLLLAIAAVHLLLAFVAFHIMERRLESPLLPALSKLSAFPLLALVDLVAGGLLYYFGPTLGTRAAIFCVVHLIAGLFLTLCVTPWREALKSWVWRFQGRVPWWRDSLLGNRADNRLAVVAFALLGLAGLGLFAVLPAVLMAEDYQRPELEWPAVFGSAGLMVLLLLAGGVMYQWFVMTAGNSGTGMFVGLLPILIMVPHLGGLYLKAQQNQMILLTGNAPGTRAMTAADWIMAVSPSAHFAQWIAEPEASLNVTPVVVLYGLILIVSWSSVRTRLRNFGGTVHRKLVKMGVFRKDEDAVLDVTVLSP